MKSSLGFEFSQYLHRIFTSHSYGSDGQSRGQAADAGYVAWTQWKLEKVERSSDYEVVAIIKGKSARLRIELKTDEQEPYAIREMGLERIEQ